ncbi:DUF1190 domain-containing protein [Paracoccus laeviglucosivorans]|uniref:Uncharacterized conserved protein YgiB, involved in bioifilm formation, UPF0441/DUF1190 family n=1 Tax=Paracoccus laeviglucosivorans TaxID=1197861 RepID=A0A521BPD2_9RHOB|nr:DUF1190 domain-containing protein [Paracoccus laeviglucosivorans]SMO49007.1 Uncharacterized conserved protein YgiB, involved in bioifilm formation, UPF0441/DUF1190 family [Paracoccus laeviglucosivorans]
MKSRKRSRRVALVLVGTASLALAACRDEQVDAQSFPDLQSCIAAAKENSLWFTEQDCRTNFAAAEAEYAETAPRYESKELCEQEHGAGNCGGDPTQAAGDQVAQQSGGGMGSIFMPLLMGYMMGSMLSGGRGVSSQPLVRTADGRYSTPSGNQSFATNRGAGQVSPNTFQRAPSTAGKPPMSASQVSQRGGFGASSTARAAGGSTRSFGG